MKYKVLLMGNNKSMIDDFFGQMLVEFECQYTSNRYEDIMCHIRYFKPDMIVYCLHNEVRESMLHVFSIRQDMARECPPVTIIGSEEMCAEYRSATRNGYELELLKPVSANQIQERITGYLKTHVKMQEPAEAAFLEQSAPASEHQSLFDELDALFAGTLVPPPQQPQAPQHRRHHILVVDDDARMLKVIKRDLEDKYDVATAINGRVALKFLEKKSTDLILLDYIMPEQDGVSIFRQLRLNQRTKDIPVIFLTGVNDRSKIQKVLSLKPQGYLLKPVDRAKLLEIIKDTIG